LLLSFAVMHRLKSHGHENATGASLYYKNPHMNKIWTYWLIKRK